MALSKESVIRMLEIRSATSSDDTEIFEVHAAAFPTPAEAKLVRSLSIHRNLAISLVAVEQSRVVGHIAFSPITVDGQPIAGLGLAPVAVLPTYQRQGIGAALVRAGIAVAQDRGARLVVVLGDPAYYSRFGFSPAHLVGLDNEYGAYDEFMAIDLLPGERMTRGMVRYAPEFSELDAEGA